MASDAVGHHCTTYTTSPGNRAHGDFPMPPSCFPTPAPSIPLGPHPIQVERWGFDLVGGGTGDPPVLSQSIEQEAVGNPTLTHGP